MLMVCIMDFIVSFIMACSMAGILANIRCLYVSGPSLHRFPKKHGA